MPTPVRAILGRIKDTNALAEAYAQADQQAADQHHPARPRKAVHRCPRCQYELEGLDNPRCPECGLQTFGLWSVENRVSTRLLTGIALWTITLAVSVAAPMLFYLQENMLDASINLIALATAALTINTGIAIWIRLHKGEIFWLDPTTQLAARVYARLQAYAAALAIAVLILTWTTDISTFAWSPLSGGAFGP